MNFTARLYRGSPIWRQWREHRRIGGMLGGVVFTWVPGDDYVAPGGLSAGEVSALRRVSGVRIEAVSVLAPTMLPSSAVDVPVVVDASLPPGVVELRNDDQVTRVVNVGTVVPVNPLLTETLKLRSDRPKSKGRR